MRRGIHFPPWWMLMEILTVLSGQGALVGIKQ
jgi:hypothetical protein